MYETTETETLAVRENRELVEVSVELFDDPEHRRHSFQVPEHATLLEVLDEGARKFDKQLLPDAKHPLDQLHGVYEHHQYGPRLNLEQTVKEFLEHQPPTHHFAIELVLAIRVNTRWREATAKEMTPKAILTLFGLSPDEYSLYLPGSKTPLPPDTPVALHRGEHFEAQKDGKYGEEECGADR